ncbi:FFLEELY motif protein [Janthinobacterium sp.]|uniref:FFLEELY motif protein n=1 Tax=Janthinobacterium sp. TaxID=1871054 RepID=UPI00293D7BF1|nr:hypothetical protein [Janthinobacterium sp.]
MEPAETIRNAVASVSLLRVETATSPALLVAVRKIKLFQAQRFRATYADLLISDDFGPATQFFLDELYSDKDFAQRDAQFAKIAGALQTLFPKQVVQTAVTLAQLHRLTEELDHQMGIAMLSASAVNEVRTYVQAWKTLGRRQDRELQLQTVLSVGLELERLTRTPGLRLMLKMMRRPANAAGLGALQAFLEAGFDTFASMSGKKQLVSSFLSTIEDRESNLIQALFSPQTATIEKQLRQH